MKATKAPNTKYDLLLQQRIIEQYGQLVLEYGEKYCDRCYREKECGLLPVTSAGELCPYFGEVN